MDGTPQQRALNEVQHEFGKSAFTEDHGDFCMVGFARGGKVISAKGETWEEAIAALRKKAVK